MECDKEMTEEYTQIPIIPEINTLEELIAELQKVFQEDRINVEHVKAVLGAYTSRPRDWRKYAKFDPHRYTRNLVDTGNDKYNLIALCWSEGQGSGIHSHADSHCFVKVLDGDLRETMYDWPKPDEEGEMKQKEINTYGKNGVTYINDSMGLHRMENPSNSDQCVSLHLYSPPFNMCKCFDQRTGHVAETKVTFWSQFGNRTPFKVLKKQDSQACFSVEENAEIDANTLPYCGSPITECENN
ncbi:unnamed protein product [Owenia fusiformis]|uniref:Cysteine dioxygenase n=1 Tax=Owenia fusiformis TaxID=6347 RepID=A0A8J1TRW7_OWEFU|nr:unnamed protein product [Owenia fusiformis]